MAEFKTKYSIGDKVYIVTDGSLVNDTDVELKEITAIEVSNRTTTTYSVGYNTHRSEMGIFTDLKVAKNAAIKRINEKATGRIKYITEKRLAEAEVNN
jgi:hypothetical protein